ncbi:hypothetical protein MRB53_000289 [Persea americana]|uniref:Uncharacterized protein n=1 Tax=Persea americana TaxID=3435 RepID=A0ACC2MNM4_PERAE|nr:hypothetical protein MRB53_000289 [Persea americana]
MDMNQEEDYNGFTQPQQIPSYFSYSERIPNSMERSNYMENLSIRSFDESRISTQTMDSSFYNSSSEDDTFSFSSSLPPPPPPPPPLVDGHHLTSPFLRRQLSSSSSSDDDGELVGSGGGRGIFKLPVRAAVHPCRPPSLEVRPHPLRETQVGSFLRNIAATDQQMWAGAESGMRFWNLEDLFRPSAGQHQRGDEETAPFRESEGRIPAAMCLIADLANRLVWSGHKDGKIRSWKMEQSLDGSGGGGGGGFREGLTWQAHRSPVLSIVMTAYGMLDYGDSTWLVSVNLTLVLYNYTSYIVVFNLIQD